MVEYWRRERTVLMALGGFELVALNSLFVWGVFARPDAIADAFTNPISLVFIAESFLLLGVFAYLMRKWGVLRLPWGWFVGLALLGSMLFALPVVLLWRRRVDLENPRKPVSE